MYFGILDFGDLRQTAPDVNGVPLWETTLTSHIAAC